MSHVTGRRYFTRSLLLACSFLSAFASRWPEPPLWTDKDPCPSILRSIVPSYQPFGGWEAVHNAMTTCSNITEVDLRNGGPSCTEFPDGYNLPFRPDGSDRYRRHKYYRYMTTSFKSLSWNICGQEHHIGQTMMAHGQCRVPQMPL